NHTKVNKMLKSPTTGANTFNEEIVHNDKIAEWFSKG
ncbi:MAG: DUF4295 family protein, partial [Bacteroidota bacterium]